jgi:hypothetical protein
MREINIRPALNGWVCQVGCQTVVFNDKHSMLDEIARYIDDPRALEIEYRKNSPNKYLNFESVPAPETRELLLRREGLDMGGGVATTPYPTQASAEFREAAVGAAALNR